jgi:hypothetical protein
MLQNSLESLLFQLGAILKIKLSENMHFTCTTFFIFLVVMQHAKIHIFASSVMIERFFYNIVFLYHLLYLLKCSVMMGI